VVVPVGMAKFETGRDAPFDEELPTMDGAMVRRAQDDQSIWIVVGAFGTKPYVVNVEKNSVSAAWDDTLSVISAHDLAPDRRGNVLARSSWRRGGHDAFATHVGAMWNVSNALSVAAGRLHGCCIDHHRLPRRILPPATALFANRQRHLIARPSRIR